MLNPTTVRPRRSRFYRFFRPLSIATLTALLLLASFGPTLAFGVDDWQVQLGGYVPAELAAPSSLTANQPFVLDGREMDISLALNPRNYSELWALADAQGDPTSLHYHQFLTPQEFIDHYSPTEADYAATLDWLKKSGFTITRTYSNRMMVDARGSVITVARAFNTSFGNFYDSFSKKTSFGVTVNPSLPNSLVGKVSYIGGLTSRNFFRPATPHAPDAPVQQSAEQTRRSGFTPQQIRTAYGSEGLVAQGISGKGLTIGILLFDAFFEQSDIDNFSNTYGLPKKNVTLVGSLSAPGNPNYDFGLYAETNVDLQWAHASAPDADLVLYSESVNTDADLLRMFQKFVNENRADILNLSWGGPESIQPSDIVKAINTSLLQGSVQGTSIFISSGDSGIFGEAQFQGRDANKVTASYPSSLPFVTSVGGTTLKLNPDSSIANEVGWSIQGNDPEKVSGGGGKSTFFARPSYQRNFSPSGGRGLPDISANADPNTPYNLFIQPRFAGSSLPPGIFAIGNGTSNSSPLWAGFCALLAQQAGGRLGLINYALYDLNFSISHDILQGFNGESARPGWDFVTGLGVARIDLLSRFFPTRSHSTALPPGATVFERLNPNLSVTPGGTFTLIVGIRNNTDAAMNNPIVTVPIPAGSRLVNAQFTGGGAGIASQNEGSATLNYGGAISPYQNATGFITLQAPDAPVGTVISHRSTVSWNQNGNQSTLVTNGVDLTIADTSETDGSQDGLLGGYFSREEGSGDFVLRDGHFGPGENWSISLTDNKGNLQSVPEGRIVGGAADGNGNIEVRVLTKNWPTGNYTLLIRGNNTGLEVVASFNVG